MYSASGRVSPCNNLRTLEARAQTPQFQYIIGCKSEFQTTLGYIAGTRVSEQTDLQVTKLVTVAQEQL